MNPETLSKLAIESGIAPNDLFATPHFAELASALVQACAQIQHERSCQRHGYDKYEDAQAILDHFGLR